ncbi:DUF2750 domain-containing protein [Microbulbifer thermotolerans]|uniref:DUF2750 domain-containing protein n=1 Tax=Microbulbifer thermotolerans TaxID=252514 RepID=UPI002249513F|nr:DUF2750 domain-containing protein [Microbulbifer thermotolerans]MCX2783016.1 DUF2750 domain-containing protein [Microbulbifer thermotolerans]MCX2832248.1 DUF2750 domain-containing protein [Microbulbifer thermotolerans]MCX2842327.1 DUF2750 domain-containing protein [Microbulbifer thermotolerans]
MQIEPLSDDFEHNCARFLPEAAAQGCVWALEGNEGFALCESVKYPQTEVMPFWSQREFAEIHVEGDWAEYQVVPIDLEEFMDDWLTGMHEDVLLVGINWNRELEGIEMEPLDLLEQLEQELL